MDLDQKDSSVLGAGASPAGSLRDLRLLPHTRHGTIDSFSTRRRSRISLDSDYQPRVSVSCVARQTSGEDCTRQKFIVWAAVKRNRSLRMVSSEKLKCPLYQCRQPFESHEMMLRHLTDCRHFASGEYFCYDCMRVEKFNDGKCKCCLGHPTKRRRIINMAKNFFSNLGHKSRKETTSDTEQDDDFSAAPPSYESLDVVQQLQLGQEPSLESGGTEILELDAGPLPPAELDSANYQGKYTDCDVLDPVPAVSPLFPEVTGASDFFDMHVNNPFSFQDERAPSPASSRPSLALDTHNIGGPPRKVPRTKYLSPSSSLRSNQSSQIISPVGSDSVGWTLSSTLDTTLASPITPFSADDADSTALSRENSCKFPKDYPIAYSNGQHWFDEYEKAALPPQSSDQDDGVNYSLGNLSELPGDDPLSIPRAFGSDDFLFPVGARGDHLWSSAIDADMDMLPPGEIEPSPEEPPAQVEVEPELDVSEIDTLVGSTWDTIREHIVSSQSKTAHIRCNPLIQRLRADNSKAVALAGLQTLKGILAGTDAANPYEYLCFVHVVYAFSLVVHEEDLAPRCERLFRQALCYQGFMERECHDVYCEAVTAIWQPINHKAAGESGIVSRSSSLKGKDPEFRVNSKTPIRVDPLVAVAQNFLDDLEYCIINDSARSSSGIVAQDIHSTHDADTLSNVFPNNTFIFAVKWITMSLARSFVDDGTQDLDARLETISQRVSRGQIVSVRRLELELLQVGKNCLAADELFEDFIPQVKQLCDPIYPVGSNPRTRYYTHGISFLESSFRMLPSDLPGTASLPDSAGGVIESPDPLDEFLQNLDSEVGDQLDEQPIQQFMGSADPFTDLLDDFSVHATNRDIPSTLMHQDSEGLKTTVDPAALNGAGAIERSSNKLLLDDPLELHNRLSEGPVDSSFAKESNEQEPNSSTTDQEAADYSCCELCGYRPKGDPQWFKGSMAKHKKFKHFEAPKIYKCPYPGCTSAYKNRRDNLRQHQLEKNHFINGLDEKGKRPHKRKKSSD